MKPTEWDKMEPTEKKETAMRLLSSIRGHYLMSQALYHAIRTMKAVPPPRTEISNIQDLEIIRECIFDMPDMLFDHGAAKDPLKKNSGALNKEK